MPYEDQLPSEPEESPELDGHGDYYGPNWRTVLDEFRLNGFWHGVDELLHMVRWLDNFDWRSNFCQWAHRDVEELPF